jgi:citrate lyase subunit beta/citryl-CoA lyase
MINNKYLMRSLMFVPAHNEKLMESALKREADVLLLDLEDSVLPAENKQIARNNIKKYISEGKFKDRMIFPRVNDRESGHLLQDIYQLTIDGVEGFMYPKSKKGEDIYFFGKLLETIEYEKNIPKHTFKIIALIETPGAVMNIQEICTACPERLVAVAFGCEDFMTELGGVHDEDYQSIFTARATIAMGAKANSVIPIDTVHIKVHDLEDLEKNLKIGRNLGFEGMLVLNPKELPLVHKYYSPSEDEVNWANEMLSLSKEAVLQGKGVAVKDNKFIGPPMVKMAKDIIEKNILIISKEHKV